MATGHLDADDFVTDRTMYPCGINAGIKLFCFIANDEL